MIQLWHASLLACLCQTRPGLESLDLKKNWFIWNLICKTWWSLYVGIIRKTWLNHEIFFNGKQAFPWYRSGKHMAPILQTEPTPVLPCSSRQVRSGSGCRTWARSNDTPGPDTFCYLACSCESDQLNSSCEVFKAVFLKNIILFQLSFLFIFSIKHFNNNLSCKNKKKQIKLFLLNCQGTIVVEFFFKIT